MKEIKNMKKLILAFWISIAISVFPYFIDMKPCAMCMIQRWLFTILALCCFLAKWVEIAKKCAVLINTVIISGLLYHMALVVEIIPSPKFCKLEYTFFQKAMKNCSDTNIFVLIGMLGVSLFLLRLIWSTKR
jgi:disulfide bond formation protein DsbB